MKKPKLCGHQLNAAAILAQDDIDAKLDNRIAPTSKSEAYSMCHRADVRHDRALSAVAFGDIPDAKKAIETAEWAAAQYASIR